MPAYAVLAVLILCEAVFSQSAVSDSAMTQIALPFEQVRLGMRLREFRKLYAAATPMTGLDVQGVTGTLPPEGAIEKWLVRSKMRSARTGNFEFFQGRLYHVNLSFSSTRFKKLKKELEEYFGAPSTNKYLYVKWEIADQYLSVTLSEDSATGVHVSFTHLGMVAAILEYKRNAD